VAANPTFRLRDRPPRAARATLLVTNGRRIGYQPAARPLGMERCPNCGEAFVFPVGLNEHRERCTGSAGDVADGPYDDDTCPMCGTDYGERGYPQHLAACDGPGTNRA